MCPVTTDDPHRHRTYRIGMLANSASGRHAQILGRYPPPNGVPVEYAQTFDEVGAALADLAASGVTLLVVAGGDGTVRNVLTHILLRQIFEQPPLIAIIASGSTNMTGHDTGTVELGRLGWEPLQTFAQDPGTSKAEIRTRPVLRVQPSPDAAAFCGMLFGAGAIDHAVGYTQSRLHSAGMRGSVGPAVAFARFLKALAVRDYSHFAPVDLKACDDRGRTVDGSTLILVATTLNRLLLRFRPFWGTEHAPLAWTAVASTARGILRRLPGAAWGRPGRGVTDGNGFSSGRATSLWLEFDGGFVVDGERYTAERKHGPVTLSIAGSASFVSL